MERRKRIRKRRRVRVVMEPGHVTSVTGDVCSTGIFLYAARVHKPGTRVHLVARLPTGAGRAEGVVRWAKRVPPHLLQYVRGGMGIEFTWVSPELEAHLARAVAPVATAV